MRHLASLSSFFPFLSTFVPLSGLLAQGGTTAGYTISDLAILIYLCGQVLVQVINAWRGNAGGITPLSIQQILAQLQSHGNTLSQLLQNQLPPELQAQLLANTPAGQNPAATATPGVTTMRFTANDPRVGVSPAPAR